MNQALRHVAFICAVGMAALAGCAQQPAEMEQEIPQGPVELVVADFDSGRKPNNLGGDFGTWNKDEGDPTQSCAMSFDDRERLGDKGYSIKLTYDVDSPQPAYNGFWLKLQELDAAPYRELRFFVKGDLTAGYTTMFKMEMKNAQGEVARYLVQGLSDQWQEMRIPLKKLRGITDWTALTELVIVFDDINATAKSGVIHLDNVSFL